MKSKTLDAGTCSDDIVGDVNSDDDIDGQSFAGYRLAIIVFDNLTPFKGVWG